MSSRHGWCKAIALFMIVAYMPGSVVWAQAYCALRDPVQQIYDFYPEAQGYRSIVRVVGPKAREAVARELPFKLHINELGKHTLYCTVPSVGKPVGLIHARSEKGQWGLVEIVWSLDLDLHITGMRFQRCRSRFRADLEADAFVSQLVGKGFTQIKQMLSEDGQSIDPNKLLVPSGGNEVALTVLRSALKTIVITQTVWQTDLQELRVYQRAIRDFPNTAKTNRVDVVYTDQVEQRLRQIAQSNQMLIDRDSVNVYRALDNNDQLLGVLVWSTCHITADPLTLWWSIDRSGEIRHVEANGPWPSREVQETFGGLKGRRFDASLSCSTPGQVVATEVLAIGGIHTEP